MATCFLVLGTPRSGTSAVAGVLHRLGISMGERLLPANPMNEAGFYQDIEFEELFDGMEDFVPPWPMKLAIGERLTKLQALVKTRCKSGKEWGVKCGKMAWILDEFAAACTDEIKLLVTQRDIAASKCSLRKWCEEWERPDEMIDRAAAAVESVLKLTKLPKLLVSYDALVASPNKVVAEIAAFAGKPPVPDAVSFIDASLKHYG